jgi:hypothetical protein
MRRELVLIFLLVLTFAVNIFAKQKKCSNLSCAHASAVMLQKLNDQLDPCDDFYKFACGDFIQEQFTP